MFRKKLNQNEQVLLKETTLIQYKNPHLADVVEENICRLIEIRNRYHSNRSAQERVADGITMFSGSMLFLYVHIIWFGVWIAWNEGWLGKKPFDVYPFGLLTMIVSLEAIFLSTFVLISQNRMSVAADQRADLDLQINMLAEHEITRMLTLVDAIAEKLGVVTEHDKEVEELKQQIKPEEVLQEMIDREQDYKHKK